MSAKPLWVRAVYRLERAVGEPIEAAVRTETYFDLMTKVTRTTKTVKRKATGCFHSRTASAQPARPAPMYGACASSSHGWSGASTT